MLWDIILQILKLHGSDAACLLESNLLAPVRMSNKHVMLLSHVYIRRNLLRALRVIFGALRVIFSPGGRGPRADRYFNGVVSYNGPLEMAENKWVTDVITPSSGVI